MENELLIKYVEKFNEMPPLPYGQEYDDEIVLDLVDKAIKRGEKLTLDDFPEDSFERVFTSFKD